MCVFCEPLKQYGSPLKWFFLYVTKDHWTPRVEGSTILEDFNNGSGQVLCYLNSKLVFFLKYCCFKIDESNPLPFLKVAMQRN